MTKNLKPLLFAAALTAALTAPLASCTDAPPATQVPVLGFDQYRPILLNVAKVEIVDRFRVPASQGDVKHVELMFKQPPEEAVQMLLKHVLVAGGPSGTLRVYLDDAAVTGEKLAVTEGLAGLFNNEPAERYHGTVALHFERVNDEAPDMVVARANVTADRVKTVMKDSTPAQRDMVFFTLDQELVEEVSHQLLTTVKPSFGLN